MAGWLTISITLMLTGSLAADFESIDMTEEDWKKLVSNSRDKDFPDWLTKQASRKVFDKANTSVVKMQTKDVSVRSTIHTFDIDPNCYRGMKASQGEALGGISNMFFQGQPVAHRDNANTDIEVSAIMESEVTLTTMVNITFGIPTRLLGGTACVPTAKKAIRVNITYMGQTRIDLKMRLAEPRVQFLASSAKRSIAFRFLPKISGTRFVWNVAGVNVQNTGEHSCRVKVSGRRVASICTVVKGMLQNNVPALVSAMPVVEPEILAKLKEWLSTAVGDEVMFRVNVDEAKVFV